MEAIEAKVLSWLMEGDDNAKNIVDLPWKVEEIERDIYLAEHPSVPMHLMVMFSENFVHLVVPTSIETGNLSDEEKLEIYRKLLTLNEGVHMMKFSIGGENAQIRLRVDLDKSTLGKDEFNNALVALVIGVLAGVMALGIEEEFARKVLARIAIMLVDKMEKGATEEELLHFLTVTVGMDIRDAKDFLEQVKSAMEE